MYKYLFFDLDGTLTESEEGIIKSVIYALEKSGVEKIDESTLLKFIGPPLNEPFKKYYNFTDEQAEQAVRFYRERYSTKGIFENKLYDGVEEMLKTLYEKGYKIVLATCKPEPFTIKILEHFGIDKYIYFLSGATFDGKRTKKHEVIANAISALKIKDLSSVIMIGDRENDMSGAKQNGIDGLGILYGYGSKEELAENGAKYFAPSPKDIIRVLDSVK